MNKTFVLLDKNNNLEKIANMIVKFNFEEKEYLVYSIQENEQNSQIFVSRLILNSEGKYFIDSLAPDEKNKLSNIVYNIVILLPTDVEKGSDFNTLRENLINKFSAKLLNGLPEIDRQEYNSNCSIAITNKILVDNAVKLYVEKLKEVTVAIPTWTAPVEVTAPMPVNDTVNSIPEPIVSSSTVSVQEPVVASNLNMQTNNVVQPVIETSTVVAETVSPISNTIETSEQSNSPVNGTLSNPQIDKVAIVSDPSLGIGVQQSNMIDNKKAGFANTKYVVIGTTCLVLSILVIIIAYVLISNMS